VLRCLERPAGHTQVRIYGGWYWKIVDVAYRLFGEEPQCFAFDANELLRLKCLDSHKIRGKFSIRRLVLAGREERMVLKAISKS
jgi:hypothetical protein